MICIRVVGLSLFLVLVTGSGVKRTASGLSKNETRTTQMDFISGSYNPAKKWETGLNRLAASPGSKYAQLVEDPERGIYQYWRTLGQLEIEAFEYIMNHRTVRRGTMVELLNENIPPARTVDGMPFTFARVAIWYQFVLHTHEIELLNGEKVESLDDFIHTHASVVRNERGIDLVQLSPFAWDNIVYPRLLRMGPRTFISAPWRGERAHNRTTLLKNPHDFTHIPYIIREYVHRNFFVSHDHRLSSYIQFDSRGELLSTVFEYYGAIAERVSLDAVVFEKFFHEGDYLRCDSIPQLASEWNALFNETNRPVFNSPYTVERVSFWCAEARIMSKENLALLESNMELQRRGSNGGAYWRLGKKTLEKSVFPALQETVFLPSTISYDDVLIAWNNRHSYQPAVFAFYSPRTMILTGYNRRHELPLGDEARIVGVSVTVPENLQRQILDDMIHDRSNVYPETAKSFVDSLLSYRSLERTVVDELAIINQRMIITDATSIVEKLRAYSSEFNHITPRHVFYFYKLLMGRFHDPEPLEEYGNFVRVSETFWRIHLLIPLYKQLG